MVISEKLWFRDYWTHFLTNVPAMLRGTMEVGKHEDVFNKTG